MTTTRVLISDKLSDAAAKVLSSDSRFDVHVRPGLPRDELLQIVGNYHALLVRSNTQVDAELLEYAKNLKIVGRAGVGVDNVDVLAAGQHGVVVVNTPQGNTNSAAEHTIAMLMAMARHIPQAHASMQAGEWDKSRFMGVEVRGKTLGVIGLGNIGRRVCELAMGLGMRVVGFDPIVQAAAVSDMGIEFAQIQEVFAQADFITLHMPLMKQTRHLLNADAFARMKRGVRVLNVARGGIVDEHALLAALETKQVAGAALDVFEEEPLPKSHPLRSHPLVIVTPHLGASTIEAQERVAIEAASIVRDYFVTGTARNIVVATG